MPPTRLPLADSEIYRKLDPQRMDEVLANFADQCRSAQEIGQTFEIKGLKKAPSQIIIQGMGGSAMGGDLLRSYLLDKCSIPIYQNRDYSLPAWVERNALFVAVSYSGNTEETLNCLAQAKERGCQILGITSGGRLEEFFLKDGSPLIVLPGGMLPRMTLGYLFFPLLLIFSRLGFIDDQNKDLTEVISILEKLKLVYCPGAVGEDNLAKRVASGLYQKIPVIYASEKRFGVVALRWKAQINENAKQPAFYHVFPEMTHAELVGFEEEQELNRQLGVVILQDRDDHPGNRLRMKLCREVIASSAGNVCEIKSQGESILARIFSLIYLGDYVSYYLSILNKVDPTPIAVIDYVKRQLKGVTNEGELL